MAHDISRSSLKLTSCFDVFCTKWHNVISCGEKNVLAGNCLLAFRCCWKYLVVVAWYIFLDFQLEVLGSPVLRLERFWVSVWEQPQMILDFKGIYIAVVRDWNQGPANARRVLYCGAMPKPSKGKVFYMIKVIMLSWTPNMEVILDIEKKPNTVLKNLGNLWCSSLRFKFWVCHLLYLRTLTRYQTSLRT